MRIIEHISPEMRATRNVIEKIASSHAQVAVEEGVCCKHFVSPDEFPKDKFWIFEIIEQLQYLSKVRGQNQIWKIDADPGAETMLFRCFVNGKVVATRLVEWVAFPEKSMEFHVSDGVIRLTKKTA